MPNPTLAGAINLPQDAVFVAVVERLKAHGFTVYDTPPEDAEAPYVVTVGMNGQRAGTKTWHGAETFIVLRYASDHHNKREAMRGAADVVAALTDAPLAITGHTVLLFSYEGVNIYADPEPDRGRVRQHAAMTFMVHTRQS